MAKFFTFFVFCFALGTLLCSFTEGTSAFAATHLTAAIDDETTTITVVSTTGFLDSDSVWIQDEEIQYAGKTDTTFTGCTRGYDGTSASAHEADIKVYNEPAGALNQLVGFNVGQTSSTVGTFSAVIQTSWALLKAVPKMLMWDYSFLSGELAIIKYCLLYPLSAGLVVCLTILFIGVAQTLFRRV